MGISSLISRTTALGIYQMKKITTLLLASAAVLVAAGAASAADVVRPAPARVIAAPVPAFSWTGFYVGVHGGGGWAESVSDNTPADFDLSGPFIGAQVGFNWQMSALVLGLEADASWSGIHGVRVTSGPGGTTTQDIDWFGTVRGRLGFAMGTWMPYVTGGWAWGQGTRNNSTVGGVTASANHSGWTAGGGIEWAMTNHWTTKLEYKYIDLGSSFYNYPVGTDTNVDITVHTVLLGINYKF